MATYANLAEFKATLGITGTDDDAVLDIALDGASRFIDEQCGRTFGKTASETRTLTGTGSSPILRTGDLVSVSAVATLASGVSTAMSTDAYALRPANPRPGWPYDHLLLTGGSTSVSWAWWPALPTTVRVTGVWGWPSIPVDITQVCISVAARFYRSGKLGFADVIQGVDEGRTQTLKSVSSWDKLVLSRYKASRLVFA